MIVSPNQSAIQTALRNFLIGVLPAGTPCVAGQVNRVPEPVNTDYVVFWPINYDRLAWNIDSYADAVFTGSITANTLDVTAIDPSFSGTLKVGSQIFGVGLADNTTITALGSGTGGIGTYIVSPSQTVVSETIAAGEISLMQKTEVIYQLDIHGPNSGDNSQIVSTSIFDTIARRYFKPDSTGVSPLYCDSPRQIAFVNGEDQFENRWVVDIHLQINALVIFSQQFSDAAKVNVISVDATYPP